MKHTYTSNELSNVEKPSTGGVASGKVVRRGGALKWIVLLLVLCVAAWFAYEPVMKWLGEDGASAPAEPTSTANGDKNAKNAEVKVTVEQIKAYLTPSEAEMEQLYSYIVSAPFVADADWGWIQAEIDRVAATGGGRVTIPPGAHETGSIRNVLFKDIRLEGWSRPRRDRRPRSCASRRSPGTV